MPNLDFSFLFFSFFSFVSFFCQPEAQGGLGGAGAPEGREEGGAVNPRVSKTQVTAPFEPRRRRTPPREKGAGDGGEDAGPSVREAEAPRPQETEETVLALGAIPLWGMLI